MSIQNATPSPTSRPKSKTLAALAAAAQILLTSATPALAASGDLDATFGAGGVTLTDTTNGLPKSSDVDSASAVLVQPDGRVVAVGQTRHAAGALDIDFCVVRYNADGSLDASFGANGVVRTAVTTGVDFLYCGALQPDGKIVVAGSASGARVSDMVAVRYNADGSVDAGFGANGIAVVSFGSRVSSNARAVMVQPDGKIVLVGASDTTRYAVARLLPSGALDATFGTGGKTSVAPGGNGTGFAYAGALQVVNGETRVLAAGHFTKAKAASNFGIVRFQSDGQVDVTFGLDGTASVDFNGLSDRLFGVAVDGLNRIVAAGEAAGPSSGGGSNFAVARFNENGVIDTSFGSAGKATVDLFGGTDSARGVSVQATDGKIVLAGQTRKASGDTDVAIARFGADGALDTSFGDSGRVTTDLAGQPNYANGVAMQTITVDGASRERIVVAGTAFANATYNFMVAAYSE